MKIKQWILFFLLVTLVCAVNAEQMVAPDPEWRTDLQNRRRQVAEAIGEDSMLILLSADLKNRTNDVDHEFRQENNLFYLSGITQEKTMLVLMPGNEKKKEFIFVQERNPKAETWTGKILEFDAVKELSGIENVYSTGEFESFLDAVLNQRPFDREWTKKSTEYDKFFEALKAGRAKVYFSFHEKPGLREELTKEFELANRIRERFIGVTIRDAWPILLRMRQVKSDFEIRTLRRTIEISEEAHLDTWKALRPGIWEYEVEAIMEAAYKRNNAAIAYPSIIGSGPNATTLHYEASLRQSKDGDLILMDAAAEYNYYSADITRTVPVNGKFSKEQAEIYQIVLDAQDAVFKMIKPGVLYSDLNQKSTEVLKEGLKKLGLITDTQGEQYRMWNLHGLGHWIGLDVHDAGDYWRPLEPGMLFTVEPGIYIREDALDHLPPTPENAKLKEAIRPAFEKYKGIGVRIEDDILVTRDGYELLSSRTPRTITDIEAYFRKR